MPAEQQPEQQPDPNLEIARQVIRALPDKQLASFQDYFRKKLVQPAGPSVLTPTPDVRLAPGQPDEERPLSPLEQKRAQFDTIFAGRIARNPQDEIAGIKNNLDLAWQVIGLEEAYQRGEELPDDPLTWEVKSMIKDVLAEGQTTIDQILAADQEKYSQLLDEALQKYGQASPIDTPSAAFLEASPTPPTPVPAETPAAQATEGAAKQPWEMTEWLRRSPDESELVGIVSKSEIRYEKPSFTSRFPLQIYRKKLTVPWVVGEKAHAGYSSRLANGGYSARQIARSGGFSPNSMNFYYPRWREETAQIDAGDTPFLYGTDAEPYYRNYWQQWKELRTDDDLVRQQALKDLQDFIATEGNANPQDPEIIAAKQFLYDQGVLDTAPIIPVKKVTPDFATQAGKGAAKAPALAETPAASSETSPRLPTPNWDRFAQDYAREWASKQQEEARQRLGFPPEPSSTPPEISAPPAAEITPSATGEVGEVNDIQRVIQALEGFAQAKNVDIKTARRVFDLAARENIDLEEALDKLEF